LPPADATAELEFAIPVREPYAADWVFEFLDRRSLPGIERVQEGAYQRRLGDADWLSVSYHTGELRVRMPSDYQPRAQSLLGRVRHVFDVAADSAAIDSTLAAEPWLADRVTGGIRVPGAWDGFETAVRAILGQQVSVARARNLAIALIERFASDGFPTPLELVDADVSAIGMPGKRGGAVRALAGAVLEGQLLLDETADPEDQFARLCALPGIGPWTAGYVGMRIAGNANAFPRGDWVILKELGMTAAAAEKYSQAWAPFRAYALMYIWQASGGNKTP